MIVEWSRTGRFTNKQGRLNEGLKIGFATEDRLITTPQMAPKGAVTITRRSWVRDRQLATL